MSTVVQPSLGVYVRNTTASAAIKAGQAVKEGNFVGIAIKQEAPAWSDGLSVQDTIADDEYYFLITQGVIEVADPGVSSPAVGDAVYIDSSNAITKTSGGNTAFGRIVALENTRGVPNNYLRIDLSAKDSI